MSQRSAAASRSASTAHTRSAAEISDEELWIRFVRSDDERSFRTLYKRWFDPLHAWIRHCGVRDDARIADLFQEVWIRLVRNGDRFDPTMKWGTWAFHIAKNIARNEGRRLQRSFVDSESDFQLKDTETVQVRSARSQSLPEEMMRERDLDARLRAILDSLPGDQRTIFSLRFLDGRSNEEVAELLGVPFSALKAKAKRVRLKVLREMDLLLTDEQD